jgi:hypothetical protein
LNPCAAVVVIVTVLPDSVAPVGEAAMVDDLLIAVAKQCDPPANRTLLFGRFTAAKIASRWILSEPTPRKAFATVS